STRAWWPRCAAAARSRPPTPSPRWSACGPGAGTGARGTEGWSMRSTIWCDAWRSGPWPEAVLGRLSAALDDLVARWRARPGVGAIVLYGSYARGDFGRKSDVDLLVLTERADDAPAFTAEAIEVERAHQLPMHLAPQVAA